MSGKPPVTGTTHILSFDKLSPADFERLCLWLVAAEGYQRVDHYGAAGSDQGRDVVAIKLDGPSEELWYFQCKRIKTVSARTLKSEINKVIALSESDPELSPRGLVFVIATALRGSTRDAVRKYGEEKGLDCEFWALTELDQRTKKHEHILNEFFQTSADDLVTKGRILYLRTDEKQDSPSISQLVAAIEREARIAKILVELTVSDFSSRVFGDIYVDRETSFDQIISKSPYWENKDLDGTILFLSQSNLGVCSNLHDDSQIIVEAVLQSCETYIRRIAALKGYAIKQYLDELIYGPKPNHNIVIAVDYDNPLVPSKPDPDPLRVYSFWEDSFWGGTRALSLWGGRKAFQRILQSRTNITIPLNRSGELIVHVARYYGSAGGQFEQSQISAEALLIAPKILLWHIEGKIPHWRRFEAILEGRSSPDGY